MDESSRGNCSTTSLDKFMALIKKQNPMRVNELVVVNAILAGILVGIGAYEPRCRRHAFIRFLFREATTLFLPILSYVVSNRSSAVSALGQQDNYSSIIPTENRIETLWFKCDGQSHLGRILLWAGLVQIVGINMCALVAADNREGRNIGPPLVQFAKAIWTSYLVVYTAVLTPEISVFILPIFALVLARVVLKYYAFQIAQHSFALGRNPRLIIGHMEQVQEVSQHVGPEVEHLFPPRLIVMGEERQHVTKQPHGYCIKQLPNQDGIATANNNGLVTIDKIWQLDDVLLRSIPRIKDVCFSLALFKLLRCRFAGYTVAEAGIKKTHDFFWHVLLKDSDTERVFRIIEDELSFLHDYYYSSLPISYSKSWLPILSILISLLTIIYCLVIGLICVEAVVTVITYPMQIGQISCYYSCSNTSANISYTDHAMVNFGNVLYDLVPAVLLLVLVVLAETRDITSYLCSNWTKVALICYYVVSHDIRQRSPRVQKWVSRVLRCRCNLMKHWDDKMNQCSVLVLHPRKPSAVLFVHLLHLPDRKKNVKIPTLVKAAIVDALRSSNGTQGIGVAFLCRSIDAGNFRGAYNGRGTADTILIWHIATSILEVRHPQPRPPASDNRITATHLSRYCAYLVAYVPELLPDDDPWCKSLYKDVKKDAEHVLAGGIGVSTPEVEYQQLVELLSASKHEVLEKGTELGKRLADLNEEKNAWEALAGFWSKMILYVAPSDNLNGHAEAIARGGELITLLWALLAHVGIVSRADDTAADTASAPADV